MAASRGRPISATTRSAGVTSFRKSARWWQRRRRSRTRRRNRRGRILGIGGIFFKTPNPAKARAWYAQHLGLADKGGGVMLPWREHEDPQKKHVTAWITFPANTDYFAPGKAEFMVNYIVDDLDAMLGRLQRDGVKIDAKRMSESYGRFAWVYDADDNKIELWEPVGR